jgi:hypothetical protein
MLPSNLLRTSPSHLLSIASMCQDSSWIDGKGLWTSLQYKHESSLIVLGLLRDLGMTLINTITVMRDEAWCHWVLEDPASVRSHECEALFQPSLPRTACVFSLERKAFLRFMFDIPGKIFQDVSRLAEIAVLYIRTCKAWQGSLSERSRKAIGVLNASLIFLTFWSGCMRAASAGSPCVSYVSLSTPQAPPGRG